MSRLAFTAITSESSDPSIICGSAAMLMKELCSYAWVHATYGEQLPAASWLNAPRRAAIEQRPTGT